MSADDPFGFSSTTDPETSSRRGSPTGGFETPVSADARASRTPVGLLFFATAVGIVAFVVAVVLGSQPSMAILAWVLGGPIGIGLYAAFRMRDTSARARPFYAATTLGRAASWTALIVLVIGVLAAALRIAQWIGHL